LAGDVLLGIPIALRVGRRIPSEAVAVTRRCRASAGGGGIAIGRCPHCGTTTATSKARSEEIGYAGSTSADACLVSGGHVSWVLVVVLCDVAKTVRSVRAAATA
jgi:hypothetical protein